MLTIKAEFTINGESALEHIRNLEALSDEIRTRIGKGVMMASEHHEEGTYFYSVEEIKTHKQHVVTVQSFAKVVLKNCVRTVSKAQYLEDNARIRLNFTDGTSIVRKEFDEVEVVS